MAEHVTVEPMDELNQQLVDFVHPNDWVNPAPAPKYNLVVIGAGPAGLITAAIAAGMGAKVALVEKHLMGGDCLNVGCVPSKCLIRSGRLGAEMRAATKLGIHSTEPAVDFPAVMKRMREVRTGISHVDSAKRYTEELGVDVFLGEAQFADANTVAVGDAGLKYKRAVICTGARALELPIPGLADAGYHTNETIFSIPELPKRLAVIGAGPIGCELAQAFQGLGAQVTVLEVAPQIMGREDQDAAAIVQRQMESEGVRFVLGCTIEDVQANNGAKTLQVSVDGTVETIEVDDILVGAGRKPNVEGLNLEAAGVAYDAMRGITVNDQLQTSTPNIYAAGDVCMAWKFTHAADFAARTVIRNTLFMGRAKLSSLTMPWCTYTHPEVAHVGMYESEAREKGIEVDTYVQSFEDVDRALADGEPEGFVKVHTKKGADKIVGATIVASSAGDMISEITLAMVNGVGLKGFANTIHPYPTQADAIRRIGDQYNKTRFTPFAQKVFAWWLKVTR